jgi:SAM-dependent methyltransferase
VAMPYDYDANPARYRLGVQVTDVALHPGVTPLHTRIWELLPERADLVIADVGSADGPLATARPAGRLARLVGIDRSAVLLAGHPGPAVRADAVALPLADGSVTAVVAVNMLYHLADPVAAIREAHRVLAVDGVFIASTISRHDSPELAAVWRPAPSTFDAEDAAALASRVFGHVQSEWWDAPLVTLVNQVAVRDYLVARWVPAEQAAAAASRFAAPLTVTKRGALLICRR